MRRWRRAPCAGRRARRRGRIRVASPRRVQESAPAPARCFAWPYRGPTRRVPAPLAARAHPRCTRPERRTHPRLRRCSAARPRTRARGASPQAPRAARPFDRDPLLRGRSMQPAVPCVVQ
eukprot:Amastigsp_a516395_10.p3 type:complete len:120 gc:universal Amastigsp_a516395_10:231-590(+)